MKPQLSEAETSQVREIAQSILNMTKHEGWPHFVKAAEALAQNHVGKHREFNAESAVLIASKVAFASGIHACIDLVKQQQGILSSLSKPES